METETESEGDKLYQSTIRTQLSGYDQSVMSCIDNATKMLIMIHC